MEVRIPRLIYYTAQSVVYIGKGRVKKLQQFKWHFADQSITNEYLSNNTVFRLVVVGTYLTTLKAAAVRSLRQTEQAKKFHRRRRRDADDYLSQYIKLLRFYFRTCATFMASRRPRRPHARRHFPTNAPGHASELRGPNFAWSTVSPSFLSNMSQKLPNEGQTQRTHCLPTQ